MANINTVHSVQEGGNNKLSDMSDKIKWNFHTIKKKGLYYTESWLNVSIWSQVFIDIPTKVDNSQNLEKSCYCSPYCFHLNSRKQRKTTLTDPRNNHFNLEYSFRFSYYCFPQHWQIRETTISTWNTVLGFLTTAFLNTDRSEKQPFQLGIKV